MATLFKNATVLDGTGTRPAFKSDILVDGGLIKDIRPGLEVDGATVIDVAGRYICPAFIDAHRHLDAEVLRNPDFGIIEKAQGIATAFGGLCGMSLPYADRAWADYISPCLGQIPDSMLGMDFRSFYKKLESKELPLDLGFFLGMGSVTSAIQGMAGVRWDDQALAKAQAMIMEALDAGAFGISMGVMYEPERFNSKEDYIRILSVARHGRRPLVVHLRSEGDGLVEAIEEACSIADALSMPLVISHFKVFGRQNWNRTIHAAIARVEQWRSRGLEVSVDFYPYDAGSTTMLTLIPPCVQKDSLEATINYLSSHKGRMAFKEAIVRMDHGAWDNMVASIGWDRVILSSGRSSLAASYIGMDIQSIADSVAEDPCDIFIDILEAEEGQAAVIVRSMAAEDVDAVASLGYSALISDSLYGGGSHPHPRLCGSFAHFLSDFVFKRHVLSLEEAVWKMTGLVSSRYGFGDRGVLEKGKKADLVIFDRDSIEDRTSYGEPTALPAGINLLCGEGKLLRQGS